jgi:hypothetical protein
MQAQIVLLIDLQAPREVLTIPRAWIEGWHNMLTRVIVLALTEDYPQGGARPIGAYLSI